MGWIAALLPKMKPELLSIYRFPDVTLLLFRIHDELWQGGFAISSSSLTASKHL